MKSKGTEVEDDLTEMDSKHSLCEKCCVDCVI